MDLVYCQAPDVGLDLTIIDGIRDTVEGSALRVYTSENLINIVIGSRYQLHLNNGRCN